MPPQTRARTKLVEVAPNTTQNVPRLVARPQPDTATSTGLDDISHSDMSELSSLEDEAYHIQNQDVSEDDVDTGNESEFEARSTKRRKTASSSAVGKVKTRASRKTSTTAKSGPGKRLQGRLKDMLSMPLDVLYEIFCLLQPADLLALTRTSKSLRAVLMARNSATLGAWKSARAGMPVPPPDPPSNMSEPAWANLLYSGSQCWSCSAKGVKKIVFALRRRLCTACMKDKFVCKATFRRKCPELDESLLDLVPYTDKGGWSHGHASRSKFCWIPDLYDVAKMIAQLRKGKNGLAAVKNFREDRILYVEECVQNTDVYEDWVASVEFAKTKERHEGRKQRRDEIISRLIAAGYDEVDMQGWSFLERAEFTSDRPLTEAIWKRICPNLEATLQDIRQSRLQRIRPDEYNRRVRKAVVVYRDYLLSLVQRQLLYLPSMSSMLRSKCAFLPSFRKCFDMTIDPTDTDWESAATTLSGDLRNYLAPCLSRLAESVGISTTGLPSARILTAVAAESAEKQELESNLAVLDAARFAFKHGMYGTDGHLFGIDALHALAADTGYYHSTVFDARASEAAERLAEHVGKDKHSATASEMDVAYQESYIRCSSCADKDSLSVVFSWRAYAEHYGKRDNTSHPTPQFTVLKNSDAEISPMKTHFEQLYRQNYATKPIWACAHCAKYRAKLGSLCAIEMDANTFVANGHSITRGFGLLDDVKAHARMTHRIAEPVENSDFFYFPDVDAARYGRPSYWRSIRLPSHTSSSKATSRTPTEVPKFRCLHCPDDSKRTFILNGVQCHIIAKHKPGVPVTALVQSRDFAPT